LGIAGGVYGARGNGAVWNAVGGVGGIPAKENVDFIVCDRSCPLFRIMIPLKGCQEYSTPEIFNLEISVERIIANSD
jgi:hypothetical protein